MRRIRKILKTCMYFYFFLSLVGCASFGGSKLYVSKDGSREILIKHPTGEYQVSHNIFMPYKETVEIYTIALRASGDIIEGKNITVYKFSNLEVFEVTGAVTLQCKGGKTLAQIELYLMDGTKFEANGKHELEFACD